MLYKQKKLLLTDYVFTQDCTLWCAVRISRNFG